MFCTNNCTANLECNAIITFLRQNCSEICNTLMQAFKWRVYKIEGKNNFWHNKSKYHFQIEEGVLRILTFSLVSTIKKYITA